MADIEYFKPWWQSRAVWGGVAAIASGVGLLFGVAIPQELLITGGMAIGSAIGGGVAVVGRVGAKQRIRTRKTEGEV